MTKEELKAIFLENEFGVVTVGLGEILQNARQGQGLTIEQAEADTKILGKYLVALEEEDFTALPPGAYSAGFLRIYARYLGLESESLIALLPQEEVPSVEPLPSLPPPPPQVASWLLTGVIVIIAALVSWGLYQREGTSSSPTTTLLPTFPTPALASSEEVSGPTPQAQGTPKGSGIAPSPGLTPTPVLQPTPTPGRSVPSVTIVPLVTGKPLLEAQKALEAAGLKVAKEDIWNREMPEGTVLSQNPKDGEEKPLGTIVSLLVSKGPQRVAVPNVVGKPEGEAKRLIFAANLANSPWVNYQGHKELPAELLTQVCVGCVLSTTPPPGSEVPPGTVVNMAVRQE